MATLLLSTVGTAFGGPIGGAIGALVGQQIDGAIVGSGTNEGPRINDLAVTTSTYGQAMPRIFGSMRVPGSIIWSTDLQESSETSSNGKGQPKTTSYSYSISFAVALASQQIARVGRIWADGNLLRGANGDLKAGGQFRFYNGDGDQAPDPLLASAIGETCPAYRGLAYAVFEDLQLGDFGNRIPALTFEVSSDSSNQVSLKELVPFATDQSDVLPQIEGFADNGRSLRSTLSSIDNVFPLSCITALDGVTIQRADMPPVDAPTLPQAIKNNEDNVGRNGGTQERTRLASTTPEPRALRYFDTDRDFQASVQRAIGITTAGREVMLELPAAMKAANARNACNQQTLNTVWQRDQLSLSIAELDAAISPGSIVKVPEYSGYWLIKSWEWMERGVELSLERVPPKVDSDTAASPGLINGPIDELLSQTRFFAFELPWDGIGAPGDPLVFAAATGTGANWAGASLYIEHDNALLPMGNGDLQRSMIGEITTELHPSSATYFEEHASLLISTINEDAPLSSTTINGLANGENRILIGDEVVQFLCVEPIDPTHWRLSGLLRGRGGTEHLAAQTHPAGTRAILINDAISPLDSNLLPSSGAAQLAAIGLGDEAPVSATINVTGVSRVPPSPVHPKFDVKSDGSWLFCWTRRSRGQWRWPDSIETPLVEESENYLVGCGPVDDPHVTWQTTEPQLALSPAQALALHTDHFEEKIWVRQIGTLGLSPALLITTIH
jgi:hypothetical protein